MNQYTVDFYDAYHHPPSGAESNGADDLFHFEINGHNLSSHNIIMKGCISFQHAFEAFCQQNNLIYSHFCFAMVKKSTFIKIDASWSPHYYSLSGVIKKDEINQIIVIQSIHSSDDMQTAADIDADGDDVDDDKYDAEIDSIYKDEDIEIDYTWFTPKNLRAFINFIKSQRIELKASQIKQIINEYRAKVANGTPKREKLAIELAAFDEDELYILKQNIDNLQIGGGFNYELDQLVINGDGGEIFEDINNLITDDIINNELEETYDAQTAATEILKLLEIAKSIQKTAKKLVNALKCDDGAPKNTNVSWTNDETKIIKEAENRQSAIFLITSLGYKRSVNSIIKKYQRLHQNK